MQEYLDLLDMCHWEAKFAFDGLADENVWKRPGEGLLSIGELAGHVAYWEAVRLAGEGAQSWRSEDGGPAANLEKCQVQSPLVDPRFQYFPVTLATSPTAEQLAMTAEQVCNEFVRVHKEAVAVLRSKEPDMDGQAPGWPQSSVRDFLKYAIFHVSYHAGQMYSARHLLGEQTPDN